MTTRKDKLRQFQRQIGEIIDEFLECMKYSVVYIELESFRRNHDCLVYLKLYKCRSCPKLTIRATIKVACGEDLEHLSKYLHCIYTQWQLFHPADFTTNSERENKGKEKLI